MAWRTKAFRAEQVVVSIANYAQSQEWCHRPASQHWEGKANLGYRVRNLPPKTQRMNGLPFPFRVCLILKVD